MAMHLFDFGSALCDEPEPEVPETPWHGLGTRIDPASTIDAADAQRLAGCDYETELIPLVTRCGLESDYRLVVRDFDRAIYGTVGADYEPVQPAAVFEIAHMFHAQGAATWECAGPLAGGARVWALLRATPAEVTPADIIERYVLVAQGLAGDLVFQAGLTAIRAASGSTVSVSLKRDAANVIHLKHTRGIHERLPDVKTNLAAAMRISDAVIERFRGMRTIKVRNTSQVAAYLRFVMGDAEAARQARGKSKMLDHVEALREDGNGSQIPGVRDSAWGVYAALADYLTHVKGPKTKEGRENEENRAASNVWGVGAKILSRAASDGALGVLAEHAEPTTVATCETTDVVQFMGGRRGKRKAR